MVIVGDQYEIGEASEGRGLVDGVSTDAARDEVLIRFVRGSAADALGERVKQAHACASPFVESIRDASVDDELGAFLVFDRIDGIPLSDVGGGRPLPPAAVLTLLDPILEGIAVLHAAGVIHGDVRAANVFVTPHGDATITNLELGLTEEPLGEIAHLAPERLDGRDADATADVWSIGVMLYELMTGVHPFDGPERDAIVAAKPPAPMRDYNPGVSSALDHLVATCLARDPWSRPRDAAVLRQRLSVPRAPDGARRARVRALSDPVAFAATIADNKAAPPVAKAQRDDPEVRRRSMRGTFGMAAVVSTLVIAGLLGAVFQIERRDDSPTENELATTGDGDPSAAGIDDRAEGTIDDDALQLRTLSPDLLRNDDPPNAQPVPEVAHPADGATTLLLEGRLHEAELRARSQLETEPTSADAHAVLGAVHRRQGQMREAYRDFVRALREDESHPLAILELIEIYDAIGRSYEAAPLMRRYVRVRPDDPDMFTRLARALSTSHRPQDRLEATAALELALLVEPEHAGALSERCLLFASNLQAGTEAACDVAIRRSPEAPALFIARAVYLGTEERFVPALADADRAIELGPSLPELYAQRAEIREQSGHVEGARTDRRAACGLGDRASCQALATR